MNQAPERRETSLSTYVWVWAALMGLLTLTVINVFVPLGALNTLIGLAIAVAKATLVVLFFMHVRTSSRLSRLFAGLGFYWVGVMFVLALSDFLTRTSLPIPGK